MSYVSFSLKYRPQRFEDIVGQEHVSRTLMNAARAKRLHHAYLFSGPRGTGKTSTARVLAKALNCVNGPTPEPCGKCEFCVSVQDGRAMDVIEIDAASNRGIDEIRDLREKVKYSPAESRSKVYILDEVHMLTTEAFNALLKTLEEPPDHSFFVLATTEPHRVPATILSRCQRFDFRPISVLQLSEMLAHIAREEGIEAEPASLEAIARAADGGMRDAESIFDQVVAYSEGAVTLEIVNSVLGVTEADTLAEVADLMAASDIAGGFALVDRVVAAGKDVSQLFADLTIYMRDLLRISLNSEPSAWPLPGDEGKARMRQQALALGPDRLMATVHQLAEAQNDLRSSTQPALLLELTLTSLSQAQAPAAARPQPVAQPAPARPQPQPQPQTQPRPAARPQGPAQPDVAAQAPAQAPPDPTPAPAAPSPVVPPAQPVVSGEATLEAIQSHWGDMPDELKRMGRLPVGAFIREAMPTHLADGVLTVTFRPSYVFHFNQVNSTYKQVVEEAVQRLFGQKLAISPRLATSDDELDVASAAPVASQAAPVQSPPAAQPDVPAPVASPEAEVPAEPAPQQPVEQTPPAPEPQAGQADTDQDNGNTNSAPPASMDDAVGETLRLFEGSREIDGDE